MKKTTFNSSINYDHTKQYATKFTLPSETIPDKSLTIPEMLKRFASGRKVDVKIYDDYDGGGDHLTGVDIRTLDITEVHDLVAKSNDAIIKLQGEADRRRKLKQDAELEASIIKKYEARRQENIPPVEKPVFIQPIIPFGKNDD